MVELHGGRVLIDTAPREGTTVTCIFPVDPTGAAAASPRLWRRPRRERPSRGHERSRRREERKRAFGASRRRTRRRRWPSPRRRRRGSSLATSLPYRRSRRRQDRLRPRPHPRARRGAGARGAEPDLHPDAGLRRPARAGGPRRFLPSARPDGARQSRLGRSDRRTRSPSSNGRRRSRRRCPPTGSRSRSGSISSRGPDFRLLSAARIRRDRARACARAWRRAAARARRLERGEARIPAGRRLHARL